METMDTKLAIDVDLNKNSNDDFIKEFKLLEKDYTDFYNEDVNTIKICYLYINENNEIYYIKSEYELLYNSCLTKERMLFLIKKNQYNSCNRHKLTGILKFNIDFHYSEINNFIFDKLDNNFLIPLKIIDDIKFNKTISFLHDLNCIIFIFSNNIPQIHNTTKKININTHNISKTRRNNKGTSIKPNHDIHSNIEKLN